MLRLNLTIQLFVSIKLKQTKSTIEIVRLNMNFVVVIDKHDFVIEKQRNKRIESTRFVKNQIERIERDVDIHQIDKFVVHDWHCWRRTCLVVNVCSSVLHHYNVVR